MICGALYAPFCVTLFSVVDGNTIMATTPWGRQPMDIWGIESPAFGTPEWRLARSDLITLASRKDLACKVMAPPRGGAFVVACYTPDRWDVGCAMSRLGHVIVTEESQGWYLACPGEPGIRVFP